MDDMHKSRQGKTHTVNQAIEDCLAAGMKIARITPGKVEFMRRK